MGKKQLAMVLGLLAVILIGSLVFLYFQIERAGDMWPFEDEPGTLTNDIGRLENDVNALQKEVAKIPAAKEHLEALQVEYELSTRVLPRESTPDQLIAAIRTKAAQAGVTPSRLVPRVGGRTQGRQKGAGSAFEEWSFELQIRGSYDQIATFVNRMEEFEASEGSRVGSEKRFFEVRDISIVSELSGMAGLGGMRKDDVEGHTCNLTMLTYRYTGTE